MPHPLTSYLKDVISIDLHCGMRHLSLLRQQQCVPFLSSDKRWSQNVTWHSVFNSYVKKKPWTYLGIGPLRWSRKTDDRNKWSRPVPLGLVQNPSSFTFLRTPAIKSNTCQKSHWWFLLKTKASPESLSDKIHLDRLR